MQFLKNLLMMLFGGGKMNQQHMAFIEELLNGTLDQKDIEQLLSNYVGGMGGKDQQQLVNVVQQFLGKSDGNNNQQDLLNSILGMLK